MNMESERNGVSEAECKKALSEICGIAMAIMVMQPFAWSKCKRIMECAKLLMRYFCGEVEIGDEE